MESKLFTNAIKPEGWKFILPLFWLLFLFTASFLEPVSSFNERLFDILSEPGLYVGIVVAFVASSLAHYIFLIIKQKKILVLPLGLIFLFIVATYFIIIKLNKPVVSTIPVQPEYFKVYPSTNDHFDGVQFIPAPLVPRQ